MNRTHAESRLPYRPCVGAMVLNRDGLILTGKRVDQTLESWQMPQGGIDEGETPRQALFRELKEEIGTANVEILREHHDWLTYDLPSHLLGIAWNGRYRGQRLKWFALRFLGEDREIDLRTPHQEFSEWKWTSANELMRMIVPFKHEMYTQVLAAFAGLAQP